MRRAALPRSGRACPALRVRVASDLFALLLCCLSLPYGLNYRFGEIGRRLLFLVFSLPFLCAAGGLLAATIRASRTLPRSTSLTASSGSLPPLPLSFNSAVLGLCWLLISVEQVADEPAVLGAPASARAARA